MYMLFGQDPNISCLAINMKGIDESMHQKELECALNLLPDDRHNWEHDRYQSNANDHIYIVLMCKNSAVKNNINVYHTDNGELVDNVSGDHAKFVMEYNGEYTIITY